MTRDLRRVGGSGGGKLGGGRDGARDIALFALLSALSALRASASRAMLGGSPVAALRKRVSCWLGGGEGVSSGPGGGGAIGRGGPTSGGAHHWRKGAAYLVGRLQGAADVGKTLDAPVFAELGVDFGEGPFLDGVGEGQVRDVPEEGFVEREALGELEIAARGGAGGRAG